MSDRDARLWCSYCGDYYDPDQPRLHARCREIEIAEDDANDDDL